MIGEDNSGGSRSGFYEDKEERKDMALLNTDLCDKNWYELRVDGEQPDRRAYHSSFIHQEQ
jgi:hypothetical protein